MKVLLQRVLQAEVRVHGERIGRIGAGLLVMVGIEQDDCTADADHLADKAAELRIFADERGRMNLSLEQTQGQALVVSQFTLAATTRRGRRPSYSRAALAEIAEPLYQRFAARLLARGVHVVCGRFGAQMQVELVNDGPVTILLDSEGTR